MRIAQDTGAADEFLRKLGMRLRELRTARGWSADELSARLKSNGVQIHPTTLTKMETGASKPQLDLLFALAQTYEFASVADLIDPDLEAVHWLEDSEFLLSIRRLRVAFGDEKAKTLLREILSGIEAIASRKSSAKE